MGVEDGCSAMRPELEVDPEACMLEISGDAFIDGAEDEVWLGAAGAVQTPRWPHPGILSPPPPPGEPPRLHKNKRPHGLAGAEPSAATVRAATAAASAGSAGGCPSSSGAPSTTSGEEEMGGSTDGGELVEAIASPAGPSRPTTPPGPPPAEMAPPPPLGPPPSLPLDRAELKRGAPSAASTEGEAVAMLEAPGKRPRCSSMGARPDPRRGGGPREAEPCSRLDGNFAVEESYAKSPASARWVWDRILQQDATSAESVAAIERRTLHALDSLSFGLSEADDAGTADVT